MTPTTAAWNRVRGHSTGAIPWNHQHQLQQQHPQHFQHHSGSASPWGAVNVMPGSASNYSYGGGGGSGFMNNNNNNINNHVTNNNGQLPNDNSAYDGGGGTGSRYGSRHSLTSMRQGSPSNRHYSSSQHSVGGLLGSSSRVNSTEGCSVAINIEPCLTPGRLSPESTKSTPSLISPVGSPIVAGGSHLSPLVSRHGSPTTSSRASSRGPSPPRNPVHSRTNLVQVGEGERGEIGWWSEKEVMKQ